MKSQNYLQDSLLESKVQMKHKELDLLKVCKTRSLDKIIPKVEAKIFNPLTTILSKIHYIL